MAVPTKPCDRSPARFSSAASILLAVGATLSGGLYSWLSLGLGTISTMLVLYGIVQHSQRSVEWGAAVLFTSVVVGATHGAPHGMILVGVVGSVMTYDASTTAIELGEQLGRNANTIRIEAVHFIASLGIGVFTVSTGHLIFEVTTGGYPVTTLVFFVIATILLLASIQL